MLRLPAGIGKCCRMTASPRYDTGPPMPSLIALTTTTTTRTTSGGLGRRVHD